MTKTKLTPVEKLTKKLERLEVSYKKASDRSQQTFNNLGWGAGMRKTKLVSYSREDSIRARINDVEEQLAQLQAQ